jgi:hypothetical protein
MDPWRAVDTQERRGCSKWSHECSVASVRRFASHWWETGSRSPSKWIRIRIEVMRIPDIAWKFKIRIRSASACFTVFLQLEAFVLGQRGQSFQPLHSSAQAGPRPFQSQGNLPGKKLKDLLLRICLLYLPFCFRVGIDAASSSIFCGH